MSANIKLLYLDQYGSAQRAATTAENPEGNYDPSMESGYPISENYPEDEGFLSGDGFPDDGADPTGENPVDRQGFLDSLQELMTGLRGSDLIGSERKDAALRLKKLEDRVRDGGDLPEGVSQELADLQSLILGIDPIANVPEGDGILDPEQSPSLATRITALRGQIEGSDIPQKKKDELNALLTRAASTLEISPDQIEEVSGQIDSVEEQLRGLGLHSGPALQIAAELNLDVDDVESAAETAGLNLDSLPNPPDEKVMQFLKALDVVDESKMSEFQTLRDQRKSNMSDLKTKLAEQDAGWKSNSSNPPSLSDFQRSFEYWDKTDAEYRKMEGIAREMRGNILTALKSLGYVATSTAQSDRIAAGGATLDILNEDNATLTLSQSHTTLSQSTEDFYPAPRNTEMCGHREDGGNRRFHEAAEQHSGYPTITYTVD